MKNYIIRTSANYQFGDGPSDKEYPDPVSKTVPGMSVPLKELLARYVAGREVPLTREPVYEGDLNIPDVRIMDKVDKELYAQKVRSAIRDYQQRLQEQADQATSNQLRQLRDRIAQLESESSVSFPVVPPENTPAGRT